jgi:ribosome-interacting GTPase 1
MDLIRRADLILLLVDLQTDPVHQLEDTIALLEEHRIAPLRLKERYAGEGAMTFIPFLVVANKNDDENSDENFEIFRELLEDDWPMMSISTTTGRHLDLFKNTVVERLGIIRVYSKAPGKAPDPHSPFILKKGSTVADFAGKVHKDFVVKMKAAKIWGDGVFDGQMVQRDHILCDGDVVELHM